MERTFIQKTKAGSPVGLYERPLAQAAFSYANPQESGNRSDVRSLALMSEADTLCIDFMPPANFSVQRGSVGAPCPQHLRGPAGKGDPPETALRSHRPGARHLRRLPGPGEPWTRERDVPARWPPR